MNSPSTPPAPARRHPTQRRRRSHTPLPTNRARVSHVRSTDAEHGWHTLPSCNAACSANGFTLFGLQAHGGHCSCGNAYTRPNGGVWASMAQASCTNTDHGLRGKEHTSAVFSSSFTTVHLKYHGCRNHDAMA